MDQNGPEQIKTYLIPNNFIDESRVFNGALRTRFVVEAIIVFLLVFIPCWVFIPSTVDAKIGISICCSLPLAIAALAGINDDSLFTFAKNAKSWRKSKQIMLYNDDAQTYKARPVDVMMSEVYASDFVMTAYSDWKSKRAAKNADIELIEGVDFEFRDDTEYQIMTPKSLRATRQSEKARRKQERKEEKARALQAKIDAKNEKKQAKLDAKQAKRNDKKKTVEAAQIAADVESDGTIEPIKSAEIARAKEPADVVVMQPGNEEPLVLGEESEEFSFSDGDTDVQQFSVSPEETPSGDEDEPATRNDRFANPTSPQSRSRSRSRRRKHGNGVKQTTSISEQ